MADHQVHEHQPQGDSLPPDIPVVTVEDAKQALKGEPDNG